MARTLYERADDGELPQRDELLADVYMALGEHSLERAEFEACLKDYSTALRLYEQATPRADQLIVAQAHFRMALALQWVQKHTHAIEQCGMARALLEGALREASAAGAKEEAADFAAVLKDVMLKEEDIKLEAAIMAANPAAVVGAEAPQGGAGGSSGFDAPKLTGATNPSTSATAPVVVQNLGVVGRGTKKITLQNGVISGTRPLNWNRDANRPGKSCDSKTLQRANGLQARSLTRHRPKRSLKAAGLVDGRRSWV